jgi:citrate synthase
MDALRTAVSAWGAAGARLAADPRAGTRAHRVLAIRARGVRATPRGSDRSTRTRASTSSRASCTSSTARTPTRARRARSTRTSSSAPSTAQRLDVHARVITSTRSDLASAVGGAIGALKGPLHGGAPSEVVEQIHQVGSAEHGEAVGPRDARQGERLMGFGHRVYRAYDPRAAALRKVAESMEHPPEWLDLATAVEDVALRVLERAHPERALKTNVEFYAAPC